MKINKISTYEFKEYNALGIQSEINFSKKDNLEVILHEELGEPIEDQDIQLINEFEPLLFSVACKTAAPAPSAKRTEIFLPSSERSKAVD